MSSSGPFGLSAPPRSRHYGRRRRLPGWWLWLTVGGGGVMALQALAWLLEVPPPQG